MGRSDGRVTEKAGVLFDWDGVLLDSLGASYNIYSKIFSRIGAAALSKDEFMELQSPNWYEFYVKAGVPKESWKFVDEEWIRLYREERPGLHDDALGCLNALKEAEFDLAIVSNGSKARVSEELAEFKLLPFFKSVVCGEKKEELKPSPVMLEKALRVLEIPAGRAVYVGDTPVDVQAAKNAMVHSIAIARGPIELERLRVEKPDYLFGGLREMTEFLLGR